VVFVGHASLLNADRPGLGLFFARSIQKKRFLESSSQALTMFNLVVALKASKASIADAIYEQVLTKVAAALKYEQLRRLYIRKEAELILSIREQYRLSSEADITNKILESSSLARELAHVYRALTLQASPHLCINNSVQLSFIVPTKDEDLKQDPPSLRPYQTLLLLQDPNELLASLSYDSAPLLIDLIEKTNPLQSFEEFQSILNCSLSQIYKLASHLVHWKKARIINTVSLKNVYAISPNADVGLIQSLVEKSASRFPGIHTLFLSFRW
jgi:hypothetical protein